MWKNRITMCLQRRVTAICPYQWCGSFTCASNCCPIPDVRCPVYPFQHPTNRLRQRTAVASYLVLAHSTSPPLPISPPHATNKTSHAMCVTLTYPAELLLCHHSQIPPACGCAAPIPFGCAALTAPCVHVYLLRRIRASQHVWSRAPWPSQLWWEPNVYDTNILLSIYKSHKGHPPNNK
jgi:hypothetical protein